MEELRSNAEPDIVIMLVGNKAGCPPALLRTFRALRGQPRNAMQRLSQVDLAEKHAGDRQVSASSKGRFGSLFWQCFVAFLAQVDFDTAADFASQQGLLFEEACRLPETCQGVLWFHSGTSLRRACTRLSAKASAVTGANIKLCFEKLLRADDLRVIVRCSAVGCPPGTSPTVRGAEEIYNTTQHRRDREAAEPPQRNKPESSATRCKDLSSNLQLQGRTLSVNTNLHIYSVHPYSSISRRMSYTTRNCYEIRSTSVQSWKSRLAALPFVRTSAQRCEDAKGRENK